MNIHANSKRHFLTSMLGAATVSAATTAFPAFASASTVGTRNERSFWSEPLQLWVVRRSTGEEFKDVFYADGKFIPEAYLKLCSIMRDDQAGVTMQMHPQLIFQMAGKHGVLMARGFKPEPNVITDAARTLQTNQNTEGSAKDSQHMKGKAVDSFYAGIDVYAHAGAAQYVGGGGLGIYLNRNFVHQDAGNPRVWVNQGYRRKN